MALEVGRCKLTKLTNVIEKQEAQSQAYLLWHASALEVQLAPELVLAGSLEKLSSLFPALADPSPSTHCTELLLTSQYCCLETQHIPLDCTGAEGVQSRQVQPDLAQDP